MTHSVDSPPPTTTQSIDPPSRKDATKDAAKDEARNVGHTARQAGGQVASTASDQAKEVAQETQHQAKDLLQEGRTQLREQTTAQQKKAAQGLSSMAQELRGLADGSSEGAPGPARDLIEQASDKVDEVARWLEDREPADLVDELRRFARRKPGTFLLGAVAAGALVGRLTSGVKAAHSGSGQSQPRLEGNANVTGNYAQETPGYAGEVYPTGGPALAPGITPEPGVAGGPGTPLPPPPYGTTAPAGGPVPPTTPVVDDPTRRPGEGRPA